MTSPLVSVIIPTYNYAAYLHKAVDSVLEQTLTDHEVIVVDDGSSDDTAEVVQSYTDPRVKYIHQTNKGLPSARNTGIHASSGKYLAFLDADDAYHPEKLAVQVNLLEQNPKAGLSYSSRITVNPLGQPISLQRAPLHVGLEELVLDYLFAPSDVVMYREWAERVGFFDESFVLNSEDLNFNLRLALNGCVFIGTRRALTYRQILPHRKFSNLAGKMSTFIRALDTAFDDPRCPPDVLSLQNKAYGNHYLIWGWQAAMQDETELAHEYIAEAVNMMPDLLQDDASDLFRFFIFYTTQDGSEHEEVFKRGASNLPFPVSPYVEKHLDWCIARGYTLRGINDLIWGRVDQAKTHLSQAESLGDELDPPLIKNINEHVFNIWWEFGDERARSLLSDFETTFRHVGLSANINQLYSLFFVNQAFHYYRRKDYSKVPERVVKAFRFTPSLALNRGVLSIFIRSSLGQLQEV
jgi:glycosyltransferase involved in cell wall biosynthesis